MVEREKRIESESEVPRVPGRDYVSDVMGGSEVERRPEVIHQSLY